MNTSVEKAYISFLKGEAYARSSTNEEFGVLQTNVPIEHGDELITAENSYLETMFPNGIIIWADSETLIKVDEKVLEPSFELLNGSILIRNNSAATKNLLSSVGTPSATIQSQHNSLIKVGLDEVGEVTVEVWEGNADVYFENGRVLIEEGKRASIGAGGKSFISMSLEQKSSLEFMTWALERDKKLQENMSLAYLEEEIVGSSYLGDYGEWSYDSNISSYVWIPQVSYTWRPYQDGRWLYHPGGYYWVSHEPWGWAPYHYGSWIRNEYGKWCWAPDYHFSPARVVFISYGRYYGWAPIGYGYYPDYYYSHPGAINNYTYSFINGCKAFTFVHKECLHSPHGCDDNSNVDFKPLTEDDIDQHEEIIQVSQPIEPIDKDDTRFWIPEVKENFPGTAIKSIAEKFRNNLNIAERFRNNMPEQGVQNIRDREPLRTFLSGRNWIGRFPVERKIINPLKQINRFPKKKLTKKVLKERNLNDKVLSNKKFVDSRKARRGNHTLIKRHEDRNMGKRFTSSEIRKKRPVRTHSSQPKVAPIKMVRRGAMQIKPQ